jgi:hypothetical protein
MPLFILIYGLTICNSRRVEPQANRRIHQPGLRSTVDCRMHLPATFMVLSCIMLLPSYIALLKSRDRIYNANALLQEYTVLGVLICLTYFALMLLLATVPSAYYTDGTFTYRRVQSTRFGRLS